MWESGLSGWRPRWRPAAEQYELATPELLELIGHRVVGTWVAWDPGDDTWFADAPVVLAFDDGRPLELCWQKFDDLSVTWHTVDVTVAPECHELPLVWRSPGPPALAAVVGATVTGIVWTDHRLVVGRSRWWRRDGHRSWLVGGVWIGTDTGGVLVYDALDENGLADRLPDDGPTHRVHPARA